jgi:hypothetical protein
MKHKKNLKQYNRRRLIKASAPEDELGHVVKGFTKSFWKPKKDEPATPFRPGAFKTEVVYSDRIPMILITPEAYNDMFVLIDEARTEVSWLGAVQRLGDDFLIHEVFLPEQECTSSTTEMTEEGLTKLATELLERPDGMELWNSVRFWGHSHVRMDVFASGPDNDQMSLFKEQVKDDWFIRGIFNKDGSAKFWLFHLSSGIVINDVPWSIYSPVVDDERREAWRAQLKDKITHRRVTVYRSQWNPGQGGGYGGYSYPGAGLAEAGGVGLHVAGCHDATSKSNQDQVYNPDEEFSL